MSTGDGGADLIEPWPEPGPVCLLCAEPTNGPAPVCQKCAKDLLKEWAMDDLNKIKLNPKKDTNG